MGLFERYLTVWVGLGILAGVGLGLLAPGAFQAIAGLEVAHVNLVVAVFIWVMIYPMMIQIDWTRSRTWAEAARAAADTGGQLADQALHDGGAGRAVLPVPVRALGRPAVGQRIHRRHDPAGRGAVHGHGLRVEPAGEGRRQLHAGAGVGERPDHGVAFAPIAAFLLGVTDITVPWETLVLSTVLYVVLPLAAGMATRHACSAAPQAWPTSWRGSSPGPSSG
jgi:ACR3 family arsenite transporter